jgi:hypothetical protein
MKGELVMSAENATSNNRDYKGSLGGRWRRLESGM